MHILLFVFGLILLLFGGGCTLIFGGLIASDPAIIGDAMSVPIWLALGLAPLVGGFYLFRRGLRVYRQKRTKALSKEAP